MSVVTDLETNCNLVWQRLLGLTERNLEQMELSSSGQLCGVVSSRGLSTEIVSVYDVRSKKVKWTKQWRSRRCYLRINSTETMIAIMLTDDTEICDVHTGDQIGKVPFTKRESWKRTWFSDRTLIFYEENAPFYDVRTNPATLLKHTTKDFEIRGLSNPPLCQYAVINRSHDPRALKKKWELWLMDMMTGQSLVKIFSKVDDQISKKVNWGPSRFAFSPDHCHILMVRIGEPQPAIEIFDLKINHSRESLEEKYQITSRFTGNIGWYIISSKYDVAFFQPNSVVFGFDKQIQVWDLTSMKCLWHREFSETEAGWDLVVRYPRIILCRSKRKCIEHYTVLPRIKVWYISQHWCRIVKFSRDYFPKDLVNCIHHFI